MYHYGDVIHVSNGQKQKSALCRTGKSSLLETLDCKFDLYGMNVAAESVDAIKFLVLVWLQTYNN